MTLKVFILLVAFGSVSAMSYSQEQKMDVVFHDEMLEDVLEYLKANTDYEFVYRRESLGDCKVQSMELKDVTLKQILDQVLRQNGFDYEIVDRIVIVRKLAHPQQKKEIKITGRVTDDKKQPIPGVTIIVKGLTVGTATDANGKYMLRLPQVENLSLLFSFVGMETKEVKYTGQDTINVVLKETVNEMDEVTVVSTGYQNVNRKDMVGSYTTVKAEDIMMPAYANIDQMLQGQVPGMMVLSSSTRAGASPKIQIRGTSTLLGNQDPIWVVDGIIQDDPISINASSNMAEDMREIIGNQVSWLNPNDIETITVLKDASATAIYGSKASNGVIVITTKKGKVGRMSINYSGNFSVAPRPKYKNFNLMNSQERIEFSEDAFADGLRYFREPVKQMYTYEGALRMFQDGELTSDEFILLPFIKNLEKIGVKMTFRNVELNIFKNRMDNFDFDMAILSFPMSQMPGNEQKEMWGSTAAGNKGSMNLAGTKNPTADKLIDGFIQAQNKPDYLAYLRAFDRVMRHEYYLIPQWYAPYQRVAYRDKFEHPKTGLKVGLQPMTWWIKAGAK